jgi:hypothetical protein
MSMPAPMYFEVHVTIDKVEGEQARTKFQECVTPFGFRVAKLDMTKGESVINFCTAHASSYELAYEQMFNCVSALQSDCYKVRRYKIECVVFDTRYDTRFHGMEKS